MSFPEKDWSSTPSWHQGKQEKDEGDVKQKKEKLLGRGRFRSVPQEIDSSTKSQISDVTHPITHPRSETTPAVVSSKLSEVKVNQFVGIEKNKTTTIFNRNLNIEINIKHVLNFDKHTKLFVGCKILADQLAGSTDFTEIKRLASELQKKVNTEEENIIATFSVICSRLAVDKESCLKQIKGFNELNKVLNNIQALYGTAKSENRKLTDGEFKEITEAHSELQKWGPHFEKEFEKAMEENFGSFEDKQIPQDLKISLGIKYLNKHESNYPDHGSLKNPPSPTFFIQAQREAGNSLIHDYKAMITMLGNAFAERDRKKSLTSQEAKSEKAELIQEKPTASPVDAQTAHKLYLVNKKLKIDLDIIEKKLESSNKAIKENYSLSDEEKKEQMLEQKQIVVGKRIELVKEACAKFSSPEEKIKFVEQLHPRIKLMINGGKEFNKFNDLNPDRKKDLGFGG